MTQLENELIELRTSVKSMIVLASSQLEKAKSAYLNMDIGLAQEIILTEKRLNAIEINIDSQCENILALFNPVAKDLRFVISILKINSDLERIGDYSDSIADYIIDLQNNIGQEKLKLVNLPKMFDLAIEMMEGVLLAFETDDTNLARKLFVKDSELNLLNKDASLKIAEMIKNQPDDTRALLFLFSTIRKLERLGDHVKNVAEEIIFYKEAEVMKHKKKN